MNLKYEHYEDILNEETGFGKKIIGEIVDNIAKQAIEYCQNQAKYYKTKYNIDIFIDYDILRASQAIIDTLEDLKRLKEFHHITYPNRLKCAAYMAYWWIQRKPITFSIPEDKHEIFFKTFSREDISRFIHANEFWLVAFVFSEIFTCEELNCAKNNEKYQKQWDLELDYIFYFFCYRANSAKSIEAFLATTILHPMWELKEGVYFEE